MNASSEPIESDTSSVTREHSKAAADPSPPAISRLGRGLFFFYTAIYTGFVLLAAFATDIMDRPAIAGLNVAVVYGFGLIVLAFVLSVIYGIRTRDHSASGDAS